MTVYIISTKFKNTLNWPRLPRRIMRVCVVCNTDMWWSQKPGPVNQGFKLSFMIHFQALYPKSYFHSVRSNLVYTAATACTTCSHWQVSSLFWLVMVHSTLWKYNSNYFNISFTNVAYNAPQVKCSCAGVEWNSVVGTNIFIFKQNLHAQFMRC